MEVAYRNDFDERQFDIPLTSQYHFITPLDVPGRITAEDYLYFSTTDNTIRFSDYDVLVESFGGDYKKIGQLNYSVRLPHVHFLNDALVLVVPKNDPSKPRFIGTIKRGKQYVMSFNRRVGDSFLLL